MVQLSHPYVTTEKIIVALVVKNPPTKAGDIRDAGSVSGSEDPWEGKWQPTRVFLPRKLHGQRSLADYSPWGHKELDMTEQLTLHFSHPHVTGKTIALTIWNFVSKVVFLLFNTLSLS